MTPLPSRLATITVSAATLLAAMPLGAFAFSDVGASTSYATAINALQQKGVLGGYSDGTFKASAHINRAEFLKIVLEAVYGDAEIQKLLETARFAAIEDVPSDAWFWKYVAFAKAKGIVQGYPDGLFHPERDIGFDEAAKILALAYNQKTQGTTQDWYEQYARALEASNAIPRSIASINAKLTRGEMAEMMWRLSEQKTDQPSKAYMNVKYPEVTVNLASSTVQKATSCADLQAFAEESARAGGVGYGGGVRGGMMMEDRAMAAPMAAQGVTAEKSATANSYSQTNVQVAGVDEADIVKTDGTYLYIIANAERSRVRIVRADPAAKMQQVATIELGTDMTASELYAENGRLIVLGTTGGGGYPVPYRTDSVGGAQVKMAPGSMPIYGGGRMAVRIYDVKDAAHPALSRSLSFDGNQVSSRRIGDKLYLVLNNQLYWRGPVPLTAQSFVPQYEDSKTGKTVPVADCTDVSILPRVPSPQYLTIAVIPTNDLTKDVKTTVILGDGQNVYSSLDNLYVANTEWNYVWDSAHPSSAEKTHVYRFALSDKGATFAADGTVPGHVLNQYAMDENPASFRIATTEQDWSGEETKSTNSLFVLNRDMSTVGSVTDIAPGETIYSARFMGNRAYLVTFRQVDPFFVVDLSDARNPKILGQLKIPGFSSYLHPYDENHVIGFGHDVDASIDADKIHTDGAIYYTAIQGVKVSLFDVTNVASPKEMYQTVIGDRGSDSPVLTNPKALLFEKDSDVTGVSGGSLLSFPVLVTKRPDGSLKSADGNPVFQGAYTYALSLQKGFQLLGTASQYDDTSVFLKSGGSWYDQGKDVERVVRINQNLLTISQDGVRSYGLPSVKEQGRVEFVK
jgi:inhibitor of cysteine peptidase